MRRVYPAARPRPPPAADAPGAHQSSSSQAPSRPSARPAGGAGQARDRGEAERLLDGAPVILADEDGVAAPSGDDQRLGLVVNLIDDAVEMGASGGCRYSGHSKSVR